MIKKGDDAMDLMQKDEWTQEEYLAMKAKLESEGRKVLLIDTILKPLKGAIAMTYNPFEMKNEPEGTVFVFYCDTGKVTHERINEYRKKFPGYHCVSLYGGRGYWRATLKEAVDETILQESQNACSLY